MNAMTRSEQDCLHYLKSNRGHFPDPPHRVGYMLHAVNSTRWDHVRKKHVSIGNKKLDFVGSLILPDCYGQMFVLEVKELDSTRRFPFSIFDRSDRQMVDQAMHLQHAHDAGVAALVWLQSIKNFRRGDDVAVVLTWPEWLSLKENAPVRGLSGRYKSVWMDDMIGRYPHAKMTWVPGSGFESPRELAQECRLPFMYGRNLHLCLTCPSSLTLEVKTPQLALFDV